MKVNVTFSCQIEFVVCCDSSSDPFKGTCVSTVEDAVILLEEARDTHPYKEWHIRMNVNNVY